MTEALTQNLENNLDAAFELLNVASLPAVETDGENTFSNLINVLSANIEQVQTDFEDLAAQNIATKSNISSINQLALVDAQEQTMEVEQNSDSLDFVVSTDSQIDLNIDTDNKEVQKQDTSLLTAQAVININQQEENLVEMPAVEPSLSFENKETQKTQKAEIEKAVENIIISNFDILNQNQDIDNVNSFLKEDFSNVESMDSLESIKNSIDNILSLLEQTDLSSDEQNKIKNAFLKIKDSIQKVQDKISAQQTETSDEAKKILDGIVLKLVSKAEDAQTKEDFTAQTKTDSDSISLEELKVVVKEAQALVADESGEDNETVAQLKNVLNELNEIVSKEDVSYESKQVIENIQNALQDIQNIFNNQEINNDEMVEVNKKLTQALENLNNNLTSTANNDKTDALDISKLQKLNENIKLNLDNFDSFKPENKAEVLELLNEFKSSDLLTKEDKIAVENVIKQINNIPAIKETVKETIKETTADFKVEIAQEEFQNKPLVESKQQTKEISKTSKAENTAETKETIKAQKSFLEKIEDEIVVDIKFSKIPPMSGALSVTDEVAKIAMNEENSFITAQSVQTQSTSNSLNNILGTSLLKETPVQKFELETSDILNQVSNKLTELQGSSGHRVNLVLRPNDLGRLSIELTSNESGLAANIIAQNSEVRSYIEKNIHTLRQNLIDSGVNVNNIQIKTAGESQSSTYNSDQSSNQEQQENQNFNNQQQKQHKQQNNKEQREALASMSNYDMHFAKDFSTVLNKTLSYSLN